MAGRVHCDAKAGCAANQGVDKTKLCAGSECIPEDDKEACCVDKVKLAKLGYGGLYKEIGKAYCSDYQYPNGKGYDDKHSNTALQCMHRCAAAYPGTTAFFLKGVQCGCSKTGTPSGKACEKDADCTAGQTCGDNKFCKGPCPVKASGAYTAYEQPPPDSALTSVPSTHGASAAARVRSDAAARGREGVRAV